MGWGGDEGWSAGAAYSIQRVLEEKVRRKSLRGWGLWECVCREGRGLVIYQLSRG